MKTNIKTNIWKKTHNIILGIITGIAIIFFILSGLSLDSASILPAIVCAISLAWICIISWATEHNMRKANK